jgi:hypothetical protein
MFSRPEGDNIVVISTTLVHRVLMILSLAQAANFATSGRVATFILTTQLDWMGENFINIQVQALNI